MMMRFGKRACGLGVLMACALLGTGCGLGGRSGGAPDKLQDIRYDFTYSMEVFERHMIISAAGDVSLVQQSGTTGAGMRSAATHLTPEQTAALLTAFHDFRSLKDTYPIFFRGPVIDITFGDKHVTASGGESTPAAFKKAQGALDALAQSMLSARPAQ